MATIRSLHAWVLGRAGELPALRSELELELDLRCSWMSQSNGNHHDLTTLARVQLYVAGPDLGPGDVRYVEFQRSRDDKLTARLEYRLANPRRSADA